MIPVIPLIVTKDEALALPRCLAALAGFAPPVVIDSGSTDGTAAIARAHGATVVDFLWDGRYPKKRQWCLDKLSLSHDWIFFVDADEEVTPALTAEIAALLRDGAPACAGYFVRGRYVRDGRPLRFGLHNNKIALFNRRAFSFPVINDLDLPMGEIEGHYQPQPTGKGIRIGQLHAPLLHHATDDRARWIARHERYARWEAGMNRRHAWPADPVPWREMLKRLFRRMPGRAVVAFLHAFILKGGLLNGGAGWAQARDRYLYYRMIARHRDV